MFQRLPSREYLSVLKSEGVFSWSSLATRSAVVAATAAGIMVGLGRLSSIVQPVGEADPVALLKGMGWYVLEVCVATALCALVAGVLISLIQTRGAFGVAALRRSKRGRFGLNPAAYIGSCALVALISGVIFYAVWPDLVRLVAVTEAPVAFGAEGAGIGATRVQLAQGAEGIFLRICKLLVVASVVLAILLVFVTRAIFVLSLSRSRNPADKDALISRE
jgi:hypothetical protein